MAGKEGSLSDELDVDRIKQDLEDLNEGELEAILTPEEKRYMLYVERGDVASVKQWVLMLYVENTKYYFVYNTFLTKYFEFHRNTFPMYFVFSKYKIHIRILFYQIENNQDSTFFVKLRLKFI